MLKAQTAKSRPDTKTSGKVIHRPFLTDVKTLRKVAQLRASAVRPASLEAPLGDDDSSRIADVVADEHADTPYEQLEVKTNASMLQELIATLEPREAEILRYRFDRVA